MWRVFWVLLLPGVSLTGSLLFFSAWFSPQTNYTHVRAPAFAYVFHLALDYFRYSLFVYSHTCFRVLFRETVFNALLFLFVRRIWCRMTLFTLAVFVFVFILAFLECLGHARCSSVLLLLIILLDLVLVCFSFRVFFLCGVFITVKRVSSYYILFMVLFSSAFYCTCSKLLLLLIEQQIVVELYLFALYFYILILNDTSWRIKLSFWLPQVIFQVLAGIWYCCMRARLQATSCRIRWTNVIAMLFVSSGRAGTAGFLLITVTWPARLSLPCAHHLYLPRKHIKPTSSAPYLCDHTGTTTNAHETLNQCWFYVGPASATLAQHKISSGSTYGGCITSMLAQLRLNVSVVWP